MFRTGLRLTASGLAINAVIMCGAVGTAQAQSTAPVQATTLDEVVVTAPYARSLRDAQDTKRRAEYSLDAVNAEDIGKFPAQNAAEALQLVTGVTIQRQRGEGLFVSVRGLSPRYQNVTLNGRTIAVNELIENGGAQGRNFRYEILPSEFIAQIEVIKTPTSDMDEGAIGGNINVRTLRPFDAGDRLTATARANYNTLTEDTTPTLSGLASWVNEDRTFGVLATAMYADRNVRNDRLFGFGWNLDQFTGTRGSAPAGLYTPTRTRPTIETEDRQRISGALALQWRQSADLEGSLDVLYSKLDVDFDEFGIDIYPDDRTFSVPTLVAGSTTVSGDTIVGATINNVRWMGSRETSMNRHELTAIGLNQRWTPGDWDLSFDASYSQAHSYHPTLADATIRNRVAFFAPLTYDFSRGYENGPTLTTNRSLTDPASFVGQAFDVAPKDSLDTDTAAQIDGSRVFDGWFSRIAFGAQYQKRERDYERRDWVLNGALNVPLTTLGSDFYEAFPFSPFLEDVGGNFPRAWIVPSRSAFYNRFFTETVQAQPLSAGDLRNSFETEERILSTYVRGDFDLQLGSLPLSGNLGVRYAETRQESSGHQTTGTTAEPVTFVKTYDNWLPALNLRLELTDQLIGRFAASRVISRPNIVDLAPRLSVSRDSPTASGGNPNLNPFLATQFDLSLEWYFAEAGSLTGAVFHKEFDDFITRENSIIQIPGRGDVTLSSSVNGGDAKLYGIEIAYQQVFDFLPAPFDGLGVQASLTAVETEASYTAGARQITDDLSGLSRLSYNLVGFYERGRFSTRVGYFWRDEFLNGTGGTVLSPSTHADFGSMDGSISYRLDDRFTVFAEGINLLGAKRYEYALSEVRGLEINDYGRTFTFGARASF
jgi:iron complex outermembrane receptor protein